MSEILETISSMKQLFYSNETNWTHRIQHAQRVFSRVERIFSSKSVSMAFVYLLEKGATTAWLLQVNLNMPEPTSYRALKILRGLGFVEPVTKITRKNQRATKGGPRVTLWALPGSTEKQVAEAYRDHMRALSPKYRAAEVWVQNFLEDFDDKAITYRVLTDKVRATKSMFSMPYPVHDVARLAADILVDRGIKVWR